MLARHRRACHTAGRCRDHRLNETGPSHTQGYADSPRRQAGRKARRNTHAHTHTHACARCGRKDARHTSAHADRVFRQTRQHTRASDPPQRADTRQGHKVTGGWAGYAGRPKPSA